jgi:hypothetical protein
MTTAVNSSYQAMHQMILLASHHFTRFIVSPDTQGFILLGHNYLQHYYMSNTGSQDKEHDEGNHQCLPCYKFKAQAVTAHGELPPS